jgi:hypothetical protein
MASKKLHNDLSQEEREKAARDYVESQKPIERDEPEVVQEIEPEPKKGK